MAAGPLRPCVIRLLTGFAGNMRDRVDPPRLKDLLTVAAVRYATFVRPGRTATVRTTSRKLSLATIVGIVAIRETVSRLAASPIEINFRKVWLSVCLMHDVGWLAKHSLGGNLVEGAQAPSLRRSPKARQRTASRRFSPPTT